MKKILFLGVIITTFLACEKLVEIEQIEVTVSTGAINVETRKVEGTINSFGDGIIKYGHVWTTDGTIPVYEPNGLNQNVILNELNDSSSFTYTSELPLFSENTTYNVKAFVESVYNKITHGNQVSKTKIFTFKKIHPGLLYGHAILGLENGNYLLGGWDNDYKPKLIMTDENGDIIESFDLSAANEQLEDTDIIKQIIQIGAGIIVLAELPGQTGYKLISVNPVNGSLITSKQNIKEGVTLNLGKMQEVGGNADVFLHGNLFLSGVSYDGSESKVFYDYISPTDLLSSRENIPTDYPISSISNFTFHNNENILMVGRGQDTTIVLEATTQNGNQISILKIPDEEGSDFMPSGIQKSMSGTDDYIVYGNYCLGDCIGVASWNVNIKDGSYATHIDDSYLHEINPVAAIMLEDESIVAAGGSGFQIGAPQILKVDKNGNIIFSKTLDVNPGSFSFYTSIDKTEDGGFALIGVENGSLLQCKTSPEGNID